MNRITNVSELDAAVKQAETSACSEAPRPGLCRNRMSGGWLSENIRPVLRDGEAVGGREGRICPGGGGYSYKRILSCRREEKRLSWFLRDGAACADRAI